LAISTIRSVVWRMIPLVLSGCMVANHAIRSDFGSFNTTVQYTQSQQILLNIVRMHFRESPMFLQAGNITASYESQVGAEAGVDPFPSWNAGAHYSFSSKPTISYTPVEGKSYVAQFMTAISPETFCVLFQGGWSVSELVKLLVDRVTLPSGEVLVNHGSSPSLRQFEQWAEGLRRKQESQDLLVGSANGVLSLTSSGEVFPLKDWRFHSLFEVLFEASRNTETPPDQLDRVKKNVKKTPNGVMKIRVSAMAPRDAMVSVKYAGYHYSVSHSDLRSKDTLALLNQLYRIQSPPAGAAPVLTIPAR